MVNTNESVAFESAGHYSNMFWTADQIRENTFRDLIASKTSFYYTLTSILILVFIIFKQNIGSKKKKKNFK
jgi:hypothetical protein